MLSYGYPVQPGKDPLVDLVDTAVSQFGEGAQPGAFLVDVIPALKHVPAWFPGTGWKRTAERFRRTLVDVADVPYHFVREQMVGSRQKFFIIGTENLTDLTCRLLVRLSLLTLLSS